MTTRPQLNCRLPLPADRWDTRFGFFWYNDAEIFHDTDDDLDRKAGALAEAGINHVLTFSCTHFRWSFRRHWDLIARTLARVVRACHAHGIYVTEHHSAHLTHNPATPEEWKFLDNIFAIRSSSLDSWPHLREDCDADPVVIDDVKLSALRQIDGRTGQWARSAYAGWCLCFNNPDYRRAYLSYLESLYATGIDGIMTDDVQYFAVIDGNRPGHACACAHCRQLFRKQTGYELPVPGEAWNAWHGRYENKSFCAWVDFRLRSVERFHAAVAEHYEGLGLKLLRPNYSAGAFGSNPTAYCLERLPRLDWVATEAWYSTVIRYCWHWWACVAAAHFSTGRQRGIPSATAFYPDRPDTLRFTWALCMSWGTLLMATPEGKTMNEHEKELRDFERRHARLLRNPQRLARLCFFDSFRNGEIYPVVNARSAASLRAWMYACVFGNIPFDYCQVEELSRLPSYAAVVLNEVTVLTDDEIRAFRAFAAGGGTVVWIGATGALNEQGAPRPPAALAALWGRPGLKVKADGKPAAALKVGRGKLVLAPQDFGLGDIEQRAIVNRWLKPPVRVPYQGGLSPKGRQKRAQLLAFMRALLPGGPDLQAEHLPDGVLATTFLTADRRSIVIHLVNAAGTLAPMPDRQAGHEDPIPFPSFTGYPPVILRVKKPRKFPAARRPKATLYTLQKKDGIALKADTQANYFVVTLDPAQIIEYGLLELA